ncbi:hypothetical protein [Bacillus mesophilum]|uniref:DUF3168 domain-containing protein n=1 Tax=Bacillus mesophilum TaxID=1071718 RepID=A0A7V7RNX2_9BACI|nr:hypothetical protein [Bacillus mesophilum]KAB2334259.1 hypothetical protein F7732_09315 [Bacillus mesophilum]
MTLAELYQILLMTNIPVTYSHWTPTADKPVPNPPYICYLVDGSENLMADNKVYHKISDTTIELYTNKKDLAAEAVVEKVLDDHEIPYDSDETFIDSEKLFQKIYEVRLI